MCWLSRPKFISNGSSTGVFVRPATPLKLSIVPFVPKISGTSTPPTTGLGVTVIFQPRGVPSVIWVKVRVIGLRLPT